MAAAKNSRPRVALIGCGGTISTLASGPFDTLDYPETGTKLDAAAVLDAMSELGSIADVSPVAFREVGSSKIGPEDWLGLARTVQETLDADPGLAGVLILHGTATLEETAFFLDQTVQTGRPVVLVGAQRPLGTVGSDAVSNAAAALRTVVARHARERGVMVVLNDEIHAARDVSKRSTYRLQAFVSGAYGPLGVVDADRVVFRRQPERPTVRFDPADIDALPRVDVLYAVGGGDGVMVRACLEAGARGLVSAGFAPGMTAPEERKALTRAATEGIAVVQCSRAGSGRVARRKALAEDGWIAGGDLPPHKARILLMLALTRTSDPERLQQIFDEV
jgi:L-asparaginase